MGLPNLWDLNGVANHNPKRTEANPRTVVGDAVNLLQATMPLLGTCSISELQCNSNSWLSSAPRLSTARPGPRGRGAVSSRGNPRLLWLGLGSELSHMPQYSPCFLCPCPDLKACTYVDKLLICERLATRRIFNTFTYLTENFRMSKMGRFHGLC